ncbi:MAG: YtxH domain-containing protein [Nitrospirae bacterium]|nr:YtxH domain-containing protein [Nitrospirota bacterium]
MEDDYKKIGVAFLLGGLIGAAIALLYAPKSGRETRKDIAKTARRVKSETSDLIEDTVEGIQDFAGDIKDKVTHIIERGVELSDNAKNEILKSLEHGQKAIEKQRKRITESLGL